MLIAIYFVLKGNKFKELGADYHNNFNRDKKIKSHLKQLEEWRSKPDEIVKEVGARNFGCIYIEFL
jgi:hypothetical protein